MRLSVFDDLALSCLFSIFFFFFLIFLACSQSAGTLQDDEATAKIVYNMVLDANGLLSAGGVKEKDAFRSMTVSLASSQLVITVSQDKILCTRKPK